MIASAHFVAGVLGGMIAGRLPGGKVTQAPLAFGLGLLSHVILDSIPHGDYGELGTFAMAPIVFVEALLVGALLYALLRDRALPGWPTAMAAGLLGSCIPDLKFPAAILLPDTTAAAVARLGNRLHDHFHAAPTTPLIGTATELLAVVIIVAVLATFPRRRRSELS